MKNTNKIANIKIKYTFSSSISNSKQNSNIIVHKIQINSAPLSTKMWIKKLWNIVPLFIKLMLLSTTILCIINFFINKISYLLENISLITLFDFQIWRLFISSLITTCIINVFLDLIF